jgi:hypothetical protein
MTSASSSTRTVICGAFVRPDGVNYRLLELADHGLIDGFVTDVVACEFVHAAYRGSLTGGQPVEPELLGELLDGFPNLSDPERTPRVSIGRNVVDRVWMFGKPVGQVVYEFSGRHRDDLLTQLQEQQIVGIDDFDPADLHLLVAAVEQAADIICTSNTTDFKQPTYGSIRIATPRSARTQACRHRSEGDGRSVHTRTRAWARAARPRRVRRA